MLCVTDETIIDHALGVKYMLTVDVLMTDDKNSYSSNI